MERARRNGPQVAAERLGHLSGREAESAAARASRGDVVVIEWGSSNRYGERVVTWRGVDKITLRDGKILEEVVYADTAPLQALRRGERFEALIQRPA